MKTRSNFCKFVFKKVSRKHWQILSMSTDKVVGGMDFIVYQAESQDKARAICTILNNAYHLGAEERNFEINERADALMTRLGI